MELENEKRASILSDALPYIQQYSNLITISSSDSILNASSSEKSTPVPFSQTFTLPFEDEADGMRC